MRIENQVVLLGFKASRIDLPQVGPAAKVKLMEVLPVAANDFHFWECIDSHPL